MSPAYAALAADNRLGFLTWRVYIRLQLYHLDYLEPRPVKVWLLADTLRLGNTSVCHALNWLVAEGYLHEHERGSRGVRRFTLAWTVAKPAAA